MVICMKSRAHFSASGTSARVACARGESQPLGSPSCSASAASLRRMPTAAARCRDIDTSGSAVRAASRAIHTSIRRSSPLRWTTRGINGTSRWRAVSPIRSLISRAIAASNGWVQRGWSDQRSPAR